MTSRVLALSLAAAWCTSCASRYLVHHPESDPFDAVVIPGCPSEEDGSPSRCQLGRAGQAAILWKEGWTRGFIVSGSDVHNPYVEAEAIAQIMTALGVPPSRIVLERNALHTDENVYYSMQIARKLGLSHLAVASYGPAAAWMCRIMEEWGQACWAIAMDVPALERFLPAYEPTLRALRAPRVNPWEPLEARADRIERASGHGRPSSWLFYPFYGWLRTSHEPIAPEHPTITWEERLRQLTP